jgi:Esterase-like activity of phytase
VLKVIPLRKADGTKINGLLNPHLSASAEIPRDGNGKVLAQDASAIDAEGLVRLPKFGGRFFIGEENATGLVEVASDGRILKRFVPAGTENEYTNPSQGAPAGYPVEGSLPALLAKRRVNRGIESMTASPDFKFLYFIVQRPLDNPNTSCLDFRVNLTLKAIHPSFVPWKTHSRPLNFAHRPARAPLLLVPASVA